MRQGTFSNALYRALMASSCLVPALAHAQANGPQNGQVVAGQATISAGQQSTTITQQSQSAVIDWRTFNIPSGHTTTFVQPNSTATALNRVTGREGPSQIFGTLNANGRVFVINPDGILFGQGAKVNVGGLVASTHDISNQDFMAGRYRFTAPGNPTASVVNEGTISAASGGFAALVAPGVRNSGTISARLGTVALGAGNGFTLDFYGDQLLNLKVSGDVAGTVTDVATGKVMPSNVSNTGRLKASGGTVQMTATTARQVVDSVINNTGIIEANTVRQKRGTIILGAETADTKSTGAPAQLVRVAGTLSAQGRRKKTEGGTIKVTGQHVVLQSANLVASGKAGGGTVLVGGDMQGGKVSSLTNHAKAKLEGYSVSNSDTVSIDRASSIDVSSQETGDAGKAVVWSQLNTAALGSFNASGGAKGGAGGFIEISSKGNLDFDPAALTLTSASGIAGTLLLDPTRFIINQSVARSIASQLDAGVNTVISADEDIQVNADIIKRAGPDVTLELNAGNGIYLNGITIGSSSGRLNLRLEANSNYSEIPGSNNTNIPGVFLTEFIEAAAFDRLGQPTPSSARPIANVSGRSFFSIFSGAGSLVSQLQESNVHVSGPVSIALNGGTAAVWGTNYIVASQRYAWRDFGVNGSVSAFESYAAQQSGCGGNLSVCSYVWQTGAGTPPAEIGAPIPTVFEMVGFKLRREQSQLPAGVVKAGGLPPLEAPPTFFQPVELIPVPTPSPVGNPIPVPTGSSSFFQSVAEFRSAIRGLQSIQYLKEAASSYQSVLKDRDSPQARVNFAEDAVSFIKNISNASPAAKAVVGPYADVVIKVRNKEARKDQLRLEILRGNNSPEIIKELEELQ